MKEIVKTQNFEVVVNVYNNVNVNISGLTQDVNNTINNPIDLAKYVNYYLSSTECIGGNFDEEKNKIYNNICNGLKKRYTNNADNIRCRYYFNEDNWQMVIAFAINI